jgi:RND family efflux transporter MFP subunit
MHDLGKILLPLLRSRKISQFLGMPLLFLSLVGCGSGPVAQGPPPTSVKLQQLNSGLLEDTREFVGNLEAVRQVQLRPQIQGQITKIAVNFGQRVQQGDLLFQLEPDQTAPQLASAIAQVNASQMALKSAQADLKQAIAQRGTIVATMNLNKVNYLRAKSLVAQGAIAQVQLDEQTRNLGVTTAQLQAQDQTIRASRAAVNQAQANLKNSQAQVVTAQVPFQFKQVRSPIKGVVGNFNVKVGDYVNAAQQLTTIIENDFFDLVISVPTNYASQLRSGLPVNLLDPDTNKLLSKGSIFFISTDVNTSAQSIVTRARFPNSSGLLRNNQYVKAQVIWNQRPGVLVPVTAVAPISGENFVFVAQKSPCKVGDPTPEFQIVCQRLVQLGPIQGQSYQVVKGLKPGDSIAVSGILKLKNGVPIAPLKSES